MHVTFTAVRIYCCSENAAWFSGVLVVAENLEILFLLPF